MKTIHSVLSFIYMIMITYKTIGYMPIEKRQISKQKKDTRLLSIHHKYPLSHKYSLYRIRNMNHTTDDNDDTSDFYKNEGLPPPTEYLQDDNQTMYKIKGYFYMQDMLNKLINPSISILTKIVVVKNSTAAGGILDEYIDTLQPNIHAGGLLDDWNDTYE